MPTKRNVKRQLPFTVMAQCPLSARPLSECSFQPGNHVLRPRGLIQGTELQLQTLSMIRANACLTASVKESFEALVLETANHA